ncbi:hypothetical protein LX64_01385 [Chitinophaga skermanii]|uniref:Uncharacterized protein n=1 Tax=Chitinophaga skermanii TaxID=331697 RepID=A0A327QWM4_9BACT|nr:hypothetical protein [Chitinophaga skermanii]RAJ08731.1 hypothetical protein LX64_01385 [Chitinophaga skermanii]
MPVTKTAQAHMVKFKQEEKIKKYTTTYDLLHPTFNTSWTSKALPAGVSVRGILSLVACIFVLVIIYLDFKQGNGKGGIVYVMIVLLIILFGQYFDRTLFDRLRFDANGIQVNKTLIGWGDVLETGIMEDKHGGIYLIIFETGGIRRKINLAYHGNYYEIAIVLEQFKSQAR